MRVTERAAASNAAEPGTSRILGTVNSKLTRANAFGAKGLAYAARAVVQGRSDGPLVLNANLDRIRFSRQNGEHVAANAARRGKIGADLSRYFSGSKCLLLAAPSKPVLPSHGP